VYLGRVTADSTIKIGFARIPYATLASEFDDTVSVAREKYIRWDATASVVCSGLSEVVNIGRFAATLSAGAGYTWSVPTFTATNLIQRPIAYGIGRAYTPTWSCSSGTYTSITLQEVSYFLTGRMCKVVIRAFGTLSLNTTDVFMTLPFSGKTQYSIAGGSGGTYQNSWKSVVIKDTGRTTDIAFGMYDASQHTAGSDRYFSCQLFYEI
jgi:hypothetical protein